MIPPARRYQGFFVDSARWDRFTFRSDDVVISTPSKCGTTWMQHIVGMLLLNRVELGVPISTISPWLDVLMHADDEVFELLEAQTHRRFIKTHTPLDGVPRVDSVTYIAVARHPLDVALSNRDHSLNEREERVLQLRAEAYGEPDNKAGADDEPEPSGDHIPEELDEYLRWFIDNERQPTGTGPNGLADFCQQIRTYWDARDAPNVHLFHYADLWTDLDGQMHRIADTLGVQVAESDWPTFVEGATLTSMRSRAGDTAPYANQGLWESPEKFFSRGGTRDWASLLTAADVEHFHERMTGLAGDAAPWALSGWGSPYTRT